MEESQQKILTQSLGSPVASGLYLPLRGRDPDEAKLRLASKFQIRPFHVGSIVRYIVWCFQTCAGCHRDIGGYSAIVPNNDAPDPAYHVTCLLWRARWERRRKIERDKRWARQVARDRRLKMEHYVAELSTEELERLTRLIELARERGPR